MKQLLLTLVGAVVGLLLAGAVMGLLVPILIETGTVVIGAPRQSEWIVWTALIVLCVGVGATVGFASGRPKPRQDG